MSYRGLCLPTLHSCGCITGIGSGTTTTAAADTGNSSELREEENVQKSSPIKGMTHRIVEATCKRCGPQQMRLYGWTHGVDDLHLRCPQCDKPSAAPTHIVLEYLHAPRLPGIA